MNQIFNRKEDSSEDNCNVKKEGKPLVLRVFNWIVLVLSAALITWISVNTFRHTDYLRSNAYMTFQFWVCMVFIADFFVGLYYSKAKWRFFRNQFLFLLLSIPVLNIVTHLNLPLSSQEIYFLRFIPLARGALALAIVISYISKNAVTSLFMSYLTILLFVVYFCSLIFYQVEIGVNPDVNTYWNAVWWSMMNMTTAGCNISPVTLTGEIIAVILPVTGMIIFPLFTVYLTNYAKSAWKKNVEE